MALFKITYTDPETQEEKTVVKEFHDTSDGISAREWADDLAYTLADKGPYTIKELQS